MYSRTPHMQWLASSQGSIYCSALSYFYRFFNCQTSELCNIWSDPACAENSFPLHVKSLGSVLHISMKFNLSLILFYLHSTPVELLSTFTVPTGTGIIGGYCVCRSPNDAQWCFNGSHSCSFCVKVQKLPLCTSLRLHPIRWDSGERATPVGDLSFTTADRMHRWKAKCVAHVRVIRL